MQYSKTAIDPLWQCLCPSWSQVALPRGATFLARRSPRSRTCLNTRRSDTRKASSQARLDAATRHFDSLVGFKPTSTGFQASSFSRRPPRRVRLHEEINLEQETTQFLLGRLGAAAVYGKTKECRTIAEYLVKERREKPSVQIYNALIASNVAPVEGAAWRVSEYLDEMEKEGLTPDSGTCHAVLKVLAVHLDHLLRTNILDYMQKRWFALSEQGAHDVVVGLLRDGLFEQALHRVEEMQRNGMQVDKWLWDMMVYMFCDAGEIEEAYRVVRSRFDGGELIDRNLWSYLLDKGSEARHHEATSLVWTNQVELDYLNPSSGVCLNVLATAAQAGDAAMGTEVFGHLSKRGTAFQYIHYELLIQCYLSNDPPDLKRAISILTIMPLEKLEPTSVETRPIYQYMRDRPELVKEAFSIVQELHQQERKIPIALLNLLIECYVEQRNLAEAMNIYKLIHTFNPIGQGLQKSFANIETFNLLLKGCRLVDPPDAEQASFLVSELLALRKVPTALTYDRLILIFVQGGKVALEKAAETEDEKLAETSRARGLELVDWAFRHFADMQPLSWMPRFGTIEALATQLAKMGDGRCWDVLQIAEDESDKVELFEVKGKWMRKNVEEAWNLSQGREKEGPEGETAGEQSGAEQ